MHEAVEEELVHPYVKRRVEGAKEAVAERVEEEREVNKMLAALDALGPTNPGFDELFTRFRTALLAHADKEESSEFAGIRSATRPAERTAMAAAVRLASVLAPTHPHPGNESAARALLVGTPMAMMDRARDLLRSALASRPGGNGAKTPPESRGTAVGGLLSSAGDRRRRPRGAGAAPRHGRRRSGGPSAG